LRILADTSVWFRFEATLGDSSTTRFLSPISSMEIVRKWRTGKLPCADPREWLDDALEGFEVLAVSEPIARQAALWEWEHRDPADRLLAATALLHGVELWHTDTVLQKLNGFPQRYFKGPAVA
jgi:PIN domain nuclease of toxin-antitoxin system